MRVGRQLYNVNSLLACGGHQHISNPDRDFCAKHSPLIIPFKHFSIHYWLMGPNNLISIYIYTSFFFKLQVPLRTSQIDWDGSCGNLAAAVGLYAARNNLIKKEQQPQNTDTDMLTVRVWQENLGHAMAIHIPRACQVQTDEPRQQLKDHQTVQIAGVATVSEWVVVCGV